MTIALSQLIAALKIHAPHGIELPRDTSTNEIHEDTIQRWAENAAEAINARTGSTTVLETTLTLVEDTQDYTLPDGAREVTGIVRGIDAPATGTELLGVPINARDSMIGMMGGTLPSGQDVAPSIDLITRQNVQRMRREDEYSLFAGKIRLLFPINAGEKIKVIYTVVDRSLASLADNRFELVLTYLQWKALDWFIGKYGQPQALGADGLLSPGLSPFVQRRAELETDWIEGLNAIGPEV